MRGRFMGTLLATLTFAGVAGGCGYVIQSLPIDKAFGREFWVLRPAIAAALVTPGIWWLIVVRRNRPGVLRGACAGAACVFVSYPVFALLATTALPQELQDDPASMWTLLLAMSVGATVWFALPIGVGVGAVLGEVQRRLLPKPATPAPVAGPEEDVA